MSNRSDVRMNIEQKQKSFAFKSGLLVWLSLAVFIAVCLVGGVSAVECNTSTQYSDGYYVINSSTFVDDCTLASGNFRINTTEQNIYFFNDTNVNGAIRANTGANNAILDGNGAIIRGNSTVNSAGVYITGNNITIKNLILQNYTRGITIEGDNNTIQNNTVDNAGNAGLYINGARSGNYLIGNTLNGGISNGIRIRNGAFNNFIAYNVIKDYRYNIFLELNSYGNNFSYNNVSGIFGSQPYSFYVLTNSSNNLFLGNLINNTEFAFRITSTSDSNNLVQNLIYNSSTPIFVGGNYTIIDGNYIEGKKLILSSNIVSDNLLIVSGTVIKNNIMDYSQYQIDLAYARNTTIYNNTLRNSDQGSRLGYMYDVNFSGNRIINTSMNYDGYDVGLKIVGSDLINIDNNNFSEMTSAGIIWTNSTNINITNNEFHFVPFNQRINYLARDSIDPPFALRSGVVFKSWLGESLEVSASDNLTFLSNFESSNISISNNFFDSNTQGLLWSEEGSILSQDISDFWYVKYQAPTYLLPIQEMWISNNFNNLSRYSLGYYDNNYQICYAGNSVARCKLNVSISKEYSYFINVDSVNRQINRYNLSNALAFNTNGSIYGNSDISLNDGDLNITLPPGNASCVRDNYVLIEGGYTGICEPFEITRTIFNNVEISSTLKDDVENLPISVTVSNCNSIGVFTYTEESGNIQTINNNQFTCSGDQALMTLDEIELDSSNTLEWEYGCSDFERTGYKIILIAGALLILGASVYFFYTQGYLEEMTVGKLIVATIIVIISLALLIASADTIAQRCVV